MLINKESFEHIIIRILWTLLFIILVLYLFKFIFATFIVLQGSYTLVKGHTNKKLVLYINSFSKYLYHIIRYITLCTDEKPWPFAEWPYNNDETIK